MRNLLYKSRTKGSMIDRVTRRRRCGASSSISVRYLYRLVDCTITLVTPGILVVSNTVDIASKFGRIDAANLPVPIIWGVDIHLIQPYRFYGIHPESADSVTSTASNPVSCSGTGTNVSRVFSRMRQSLRSGLLS